MPRYRTDILPAPLGGAAENVNVVPETVYVDGSWTTPVTTTIIDVVDAGASVMVNTVVELFPLNVSVRKDDVIGVLPM